MSSCIKLSSPFRSNGARKKRPRLLPDADPNYARVQRIPLADPLPEFPLDLWPKIELQVSCS